MDITPVVPGGRQIIQSYGGGGFTISGTRYAGPVLVFAERTLAWTVADAASVAWRDLDSVRDANPRPDLLLLGCGARGRLVDPALRRALREAGIGVEAMDTGAACRTFNVLLAEERRVAAALIALP